MRPLRASWLAVLVGTLALWSCRKANVPPEVPKPPSVRLYLLSTLAGAMEPCGCRKDMLGGIDHAAALLESEGAAVPHRLVLAAGPLFFQDPELAPERREQDLWKAEAIAASLADLGLGAWAPGENDFAGGPDEAARLSRLSRARPLGANLAPGALDVAGTALFDVGTYRVGVAGIGAGPRESTPSDTARALADAASALDRAGAQIKVALIAAARGDALRLVEKVPGFDVVALGKPVESGDANDAPFPPTLVGETLVVQAPNHLQALGYVDLFVVDNDFSFEDAVGIELLEKRESVNARFRELEARVSRSSTSGAQADALTAELQRSKAELAELERRIATPPPRQGSVFRYREVQVREAGGSNANVTQRMTEYYRRVNDHNRKALADRQPPPVPTGASHYVGVDTCKSCHYDAYNFWSTTRHAGAYATLSDQFKEFNLDCVGCHVTGYERPGGSTVTHVDRLKDVQCESCHGPGSRHVESAWDDAYITLSPAESVCRSCHQTPHVEDDWSFLDSWRRVVGKGHGALAAAGPTKTPKE